MKISETFTSKYMKADDLPKGITTRTIVSISQEDTAGNNQPRDYKPVIYLEDSDTGLVLNKSNAMLVAEVYGDETDRWIGLPLSLQCEKVPYMGKLVNGIRAVCGTKEMQTGVRELKKHLAEAVDMTAEPSIVAGKK